MAINTLESPHDMPELHSLPDLVIGKILQLLLPTKAAVKMSFLSKQWQGVTSSFHVLDLDENDDIERQKAQNNLNLSVENQNQHRKFINFVDGYLEYRETYDRKALLDKLRLHLRVFQVPDFTTITNWLNYAFERGVKDLDIDPDESSTGEILNSNCYCLPWVTFANAKSLTRLNLECMRITDIRKEYIIPSHDHHQRLLPSLETMSFTSVSFDDEALSSLLRECPSIKHLSVTGCWFSDWDFHVSSSTLKSLEIKDCEIQVLVHEAKNLDTFTFVAPSIGIGSSVYCEKMIVKNCFNLKHINIRVHKLLKLSLLGCHSALEATITAEHLQRFDFFYGYLNAKVSVRAAEARIIVGELFDQKWFSSNSTHFPMLMTFLKRFICCREIYLYNNQDVRALILPKNYRKMTYISPLPKTSILNVKMPNAPFEGSRDYLELMDSLRWIAPSACISIEQASLGSMTGFVKAR